MQTHIASQLTGPRFFNRFQFSDLVTSTKVKRETSMNRPNENDEIRDDLVQRIRREIADGTYDTDERWEKALDRLADSLEIS